MPKLIAQESEIRAEKEKEKFLSAPVEVRTRRNYLSALDKDFEQELGHAFVAGWEACQRFWRERIK